MNNCTKINQKIAELKQILIEEMSANTVSVEIFISGSETNFTYNERTLEQLKRDHISMRNIAGEFIK